MRKSSVCCYSHILHRNTCKVRQWKFIKLVETILNGNILRIAFVNTARHRPFCRRVACSNTALEKLLPTFFLAVRHFCSRIELRHTVVATSTLV